MKILQITLKMFPYVIQAKFIYARQMFLIPWITRSTYNFLRFVLTSECSGFSYAVAENLSRTSRFFAGEFSCFGQGRLNSEKLQMLKISLLSEGSLRPDPCYITIRTILETAENLQFHFFSNFVIFFWFSNFFRLGKWRCERFSAHFGTLFYEKSAECAHLMLEIQGL